MSCLVSRGRFLFFPLCPLKLLSGFQEYMSTSRSAFFSFFFPLFADLFFMIALRLRRRRQLMTIFAPACCLLLFALHENDLQIN